MISPVVLTGSRDGADLAPIDADDRFVAVPGVRPGPPRNVAESYARLAAAVRGGNRYRADFDDAVALHRMLDAMRSAT